MPDAGAAPEGVAAAGETVPEAAAASVTEAEAGGITSAETENDGRGTGSAAPADCAPTVMSAATARNRLAVRVLDPVESAVTRAERATTERESQT